MADKNQRKMPKFNFYWMYGLMIFILLAFFWMNEDGNVAREVNWTKFESIVTSQKGGIKYITVYTNKNVVEAVMDDQLAKQVYQDKEIVPANRPMFGQASAQSNVISTQISSSDKFDDKVEEWKADGVFTGEVKYEKTSDYSSMIWYLGSTVLFIAFMLFMFRGMGAGGAGGGIFSVGKSKARLFDKDNDKKVTFKDVAGLAEAKVEIAEIVDFLKNPKHYTSLGGKIPKGALLVGPPGTGKTLLAKAVAGEADVPFFSMSGSDFVEMFVGVGASRVRDLFRQAKEKAPCIVFIDEIDAVGRARGNKASMGGNDERESTLNQLLTEMDGFGTNSGVIILAATNRADILDKALLRAGRFDRQIHVELPDLQERKEIFQVHLRPIKMDDTVDVDFLSKQTPGFSGADIANVCNEAALIAARGGRKRVGKQDFMDAVDRIVGGLERKNKIMTDDEKRSIAYHEAGHATISWLLRWANPLVKVTIVPRGVALGAAWYLPEERQLTQEDHILDELCSLLGGRAAEQLFLSQTSTGALNDLERATKQAYAMVAFYGMSDKLKDVSFYDSTGRYDYGFTKPYSDKTAEVIDQETQRIIADQMARAKKILEEHAEGHHQIAQLLIDREVITSEDVESILGPRPWKSRGDELLEANAEAAAQAAPKKRSRKKKEEKSQTNDTDETNFA